MRKRRAIVAVLLVLGACAAGCYEHVVSAKGPGAAGYQIQQPNLEDPAKPAPKHGIFPTK